MFPCCILKVTRLTCNRFQVDFIHPFSIYFLHSLRHT
nr:MAG TPA: peptidyl-prolyl cis-transisomerase [Caudoviricetes sp.]